MNSEKGKAFLVRGIYWMIGKQVIHPAMLLRDRVRGVDFYKRDLKDFDKNEIEHHHIYESTHLRIDHQLKKLCGSVSEKDAIIDVGCGKGRMLEFFSKFAFHKVDGLEKNQRLANIGKRNVKKLGLTSRIFCTDARAFTQWNQYNFFYFYNPFPKEIMEECIKKILENAVDHPRKIMVFYANPTCHQTLIKHGFTEVPIERSFFENIWYPYLSGLKQYSWIPEDRRV